MFSSLKCVSLRGRRRKGGRRDNTSEREEKQAREARQRACEAREGLGRDACQDAIVFFVFFVQNLDEKILIGRI